MLKILAKLRAIASEWLLIGGSLLIGYGIFHAWRGLPFPIGIMFLYSAFGCFLIGGGLFLRRPETTATLVLGIATFAASGGILLALCLPYPIASLYLTVILISAAGVLRGLVRLRWRSRTKQR